MELSAITDTLEKIQKGLAKISGDALQCLILYGSWAKGTAGEDSDIDLLAVLRRQDPEIRRSVAGLSWVDRREITLLTCTEDEFRREKIPLYTAVKLDGKIISGDIDRALNPDPPGVKYLQYFQKSREFESRKLEMAKELLETNFLSGIPEICFVAAKHAVQSALAMKGEGYSSKVVVLLPLVRKYFGRDAAEIFERLSDMYGRSAFSLETVSRAEAEEAIHQAGKIFETTFGPATGMKRKPPDQTGL
jgi:predicted nucleotidyltransferase/HEPN domain-containing protein